MNAVDRISPEISIIIPVYNSITLLPRCIESILGQTSGLDSFEVILIDDGSTDGSGALCDKYAQKYPGIFRVVHQDNSGSPAAPRNRGINIAQGRYVFFCDNDDYFGLEAVERMVVWLNEWSPDILLVKMGETGRKNYPRSMFEESCPDVDLYTSNVIRTLGPWKAYRRQLLVENDIRFPEDCSLDDSVFTLESYLRAKKISVASDYEYYYWTIREDGGNLSSKGGSDKSTWRNVSSRNLGCERMLLMVDQYVPADKRAVFYDKIVAGLAFNTLNIVCSSKGEDSLQGAEAMRTFFSNVDESYVRSLPFEKRVVLMCLLAGNPPSCFGNAKKSNLKLSDFRYSRGKYRCPFAIENGVSCSACHGTVGSLIWKRRAKGLVPKGLRRVMRSFRGSSKQYG